MNEPYLLESICDSNTVTGRRKKKEKRKKKKPKRETNTKGKGDQTRNNKTSKR